MKFAVLPNVANETSALRAEECGGLPTVLLVEDELTTRETMRQFLKTCGYALIEASTVEHAVDALPNGISAAVLDLQLAGERSGLEVLTSIRLRPELADIPVIVLTGGILTDEEEALIKAQHAYVFYKPERYDTIVSVLNEAGPATADRLRAVNEIARLCAAAPETSRRPSQVSTDVIDAVAGELAGKKVALVGFDGSDVTWMARALEQARAFSRVLDPSEAGVGSHALDPFDLVAMAASLNAVAAARTNADAGAAIGLPVLLIGPATAVAARTPTLHAAAHDFLIMPCSPEELVLRVHGLLSRTGMRSPSRGGTSSGERRRIIIADDDPTIAALVRAAFQNYDFECHIACDGGQALTLTRTLLPDALVLDVNMPQFDGFEVLDALKNDPATARVAVVLLSARQQEADIMRGFALGADDYVVKPFNPMELIARVKRSLRKAAA